MVFPKTLFETSNDPANIETKKFNQETVATLEQNNNLFPVSFCPYLKKKKTIALNQRRSLLDEISINYVSFVT